MSKCYDNPDYDKSYNPIQNIWKSNNINEHMNRQLVYNVMEKEFIPYDLALRMKQLGFDEHCLGYYTNDKDYPFILDVRNLKDKYKEEIKVPTWNQAFEWFREKHKLFHKIFVDYVGGHKNGVISDDWEPLFNWEIYKPVGKYFTPKVRYGHSYLTTQIICLRNMIDIVETTKN